MGFCVCSRFCSVFICVLSSFASILMNLMPRTELVDLLCLPSLCLGIAIVLWLFLMVSWVGLECVIVVFPDHTHLFFFCIFWVTLEGGCSSFLVKRIMLGL